MTLRSWWWMAASLLTADALAEDALPQTVIRVCGPEQEWPPFIYFQRNAGKATTQVTGYSYDFLTRLFARRNLRFSLDMIPFKRCQAAVEAGTYDVFAASNNEERSKKYLVSKPYYALHLVYFYDKSRPKPPIQTSGDLHGVRLCGVYGYNYAPFGLAPAEIDTGSQNISHSMSKLKARRCDAMPERLETTLGYEALGEFDLHKLNIAYEPLPDLPLSRYNFMVSRNAPYASALLNLLNEGIAAMLTNGEAKELAKKYNIPVEDVTSLVDAPAR